MGDGRHHPSSGRTVIVFPDYAGNGIRWHKPVERARSEPTESSLETFCMVVSFVAPANDGHSRVAAHGLQAAPCGFGRDALDEKRLLPSVPLPRILVMWRGGPCGAGQALLPLRLRWFR